MKATIGILTARHSRAGITSGSTFIDVHTYNTVPGVAGHASTGMATMSVTTNGVLVALVLTRSTLIHITTHDTIARKPWLTRALEGALSVLTYGMIITVVSVSTCALIVISTHVAIA